MPLYHLDKYFWLPGWQKQDEAKFEALHRELTEKPTWIIEGDFEKQFDVRSERADTIIFFDFPLRIVIPRWLKRVYTYRRGGRPDMTEGNLERLNWRYVKWLRRYRNREAKYIHTKLLGLHDHKNVFILRTKKEAETLLKELTD